MTVDAPFFYDPPSPGSIAGKPFPGLWDYEGKTYTLKKLMHLCNWGIQIGRSSSLSQVIIPKENRKHTYDYQRFRPL